jgi:hypothetical protein
MRVMKFAAGMAVGYVLGSRAGREKYEQIVTAVRQATNHPTVVQAQEKAGNLLNAGVDTTAAKLTSGSPDTDRSEPVTSGSVTSEPVISEAVISEAVISEPVTSEPVSSEPNAAAPVERRRRTKATTTTPSVTSDSPA